MCRLCGHRHIHCMPNHIKFLCCLFFSPYSFFYCLVPNNWYQEPFFLVWFVVATLSDLPYQKRFGRSFSQKQQELSSKAARAMTLEEGKVRIEKFDGSDFGFWKMHIKDYLYLKKLCLPLTGQKPIDMT